jgi:hypothetical protein
MGAIGAFWGFSGVIALLGYAVYRLAPRAAEALNGSLTMAQWVFLVGFSVFMLVAEGYRGFQKKFSPRTAARVKYLHDHPRWLHVLLAPFFCMGYFHAKRKTRLTAISLTAGIVLLVVLVAYLPSPWRGLVDFGVVLGLSYGILSFVVLTARAFYGKGFLHSPEIP